MEHLVIGEPHGLPAKRLPGYLTWVHRVAGARIDTAFLDTVMDHWATGSFGGLSSRVLMTYMFQDSLVCVRVDDLWRFYEDLPLRPVGLVGSAGPVRPPGGFLPSLLDELVFDRYAFSRAFALGITREDTFLLDRENYRKNVILGLYRLREFPATASEAEVSRPLPFGSGCILAIKTSASGSRMMTLPEVRMRLEREIMEGKIRHEQSARLSALKKTYRLQTTL
ncbi:hypothetical protein EDB95_2632 [Dinghuibacter silviterrae]|uniref:Uncharacterized protein n=2 Tax=Dinghuibacter silviterrae TaxID=1539049 RepID=A0A4R8DTG0_9BACT|nr:hypothetical protein EDB95_2632 [Dinghuibacter silviterrae]